MNQLRRLWYNVTSSFWFTPSVIVVISIAVGVSLIEADALVSPEWLVRWPRLFGAGAEGSRGMLSTIAASMMSVVGVTFSMTLVALSLTSSQYSSRVLRSFMSSRVTQITLGIFVGIFTYCLIVLRTIRGGDEGAFVPAIAVFFGVVLAVGGVGILVFFFHHIASSIQASNIIASVARDTISTIDRLFPDEMGKGTEDDVDGLVAPPQDHRWHCLPARSSGYVQRVDEAALLRIAGKSKSVVRMEKGIGDFVVEGAPLVSVALPRPPDGETVDTLIQAYDISRYRTQAQDAAFGIRQIVDIALKALSPGINDTTTAVTCVDYLTSVLARVANRRIPSARRYEAGELRAVAIGPTFESFLAQSFNQIRDNAGGNVAVIERLLESLETLSGMTRSRSRRGALARQAQWLAELAERTIESMHERADISRKLGHVRALLEAEMVASE